MIKQLDQFFNSRTVKKYRQEAQAIIANSEALSSLTQGTLANSFQNLRGRTDRDSMHIGFSIIVELADRTLGMRPFEVQIMGALAMCDGHLAEMATGEGKTLTAALPLAWHGLQSRAHAMTVNDYLAKRDAQLLDPLFESLGLSVGYLQDNYGRELRQIAYQNAVVYGTPSQFVFDYLRDHIVHQHNNLMQQGRHFLLVDEADSIFIDEARTPLVLSGEGKVDASLWSVFYAFVSTLSYEAIKEDKRTQFEKVLVDHQSYEAHIIVDEAKQDAVFSEHGVSAIEQYLIENRLISESAELWQNGKSYLWRTLNACAKARLLYSKDRDYIIHDDSAIIVDQETGRLSHGKRWNDGLHQAVEAKEGLTIKAESEELGRIALSNYVSLYERVSGMTGTAMTEAQEIRELYGLRVVPIPTRRPRVRIDHPDLVFMTKQGKWAQVVTDVRALKAKGQPVLIGTGSIADSEMLAELFTDAGIEHQVLNAKQDSGEAGIVAQAGRLGAVTIATSMAGRGTDILLGGNPESMITEEMTEDEQQEVIDQCKAEGEAVRALGGLYVLGSDRGDSRRLDLQLAGRSGRQGDPGETRFYISLEDPLMANFGGETLKRLFTSLGVGEMDGVEHSMIDGAIAKAQEKKQSMFSTSRKQGLKQDGVIDKPRQVFFNQRSDVLALVGEGVMENLAMTVSGAVARMVEVYLEGGKGFPENWNQAGMKDKLSQWGLSTEWYDNLFERFEADGYKVQPFQEELVKWITFDLKGRSQQLQEKREAMIHSSMLLAIDNQWKVMLEETDHVRNGIHLRAYANEKPDQQFQKEVFKLFKALYFDIPVVTIDNVYMCIAHRERQLDMEQEPTAA